VPFLERFSKVPKYKIFRNIHPRRAQLFHAGGWTDRHDNTKSLFANIMNVAKNGWAGHSAASGTAGKNM
jgi:hypothetical protein